MIEIYMLIQLVAIADCGTMSGAAEKLHLSQPALSRTVNKLEDIIGVKLFDRSKNKVGLNDNGRLAVELARKVIAENEELIERVRAFDMSSRTISVCSCAPAPLWTVVPLLSELFPDMKISSEMKYHDDFLTELEKDSCQLLITPFEVNEADIVCRLLFTEQLYLSVPPAHPLAGYAEVHFSDLDGETMLLFSDLGLWHDVHRKYTPETRYIVQSEYEALGELIKASALPSFSSSITMGMQGQDNNRVNIPIADEAAKATFYCCWRKEDSKRFRAFAKRLEEISAVPLTYRN
ncbi:LysR family transcriptional regulator [Ruminococcus sp.]|uniref:LysR family transcriptional regulator n=1 Tax=Ruminococcus sp. TaxID=41978 RepID=UPI0025EF5711|nr:LysR family transcriptional regulator [Ruminococcus sp.]MBQ8967268.1 LysR family transcriptional regulator [Ruminococcus sp.]